MSNAFTDLTQAKDSKKFTIPSRNISEDSWPNVRRTKKGTNGKLFPSNKIKSFVKYFQVILSVEDFYIYTIPSWIVIRGRRWLQSVGWMNEREKWRIVSCF